jgi:hypothetical protein
MFWVLEYKKPREKAEEILPRDVVRSAEIKN